MTRRWWVPAVAVCFAAGLAFSAFRWSCPIAAVTGHPCPACGLTRATRLASKGLFLDATRMHPLVWLVVPFVVLVVVVELAGYVRTGAFGASAKVRAVKPTMVILAVAMFALWVARFFGALGGPVAV